MLPQDRFVPFLRLWNRHTSPSENEGSLEYGTSICPSCNVSSLPAASWSPGTRLESAAVYTPAR